MVNKTLFASQAKTNKALNNITRNEAGGRAIRLENRQALAQLASTGTLNKTFYQTANQQLDKVLELTNDVGNEFIAKTAVYARQHNHMKDMPVLLLAVLSQQDQDLFKQVFPLVIDNGKQLRNFVQIMRSGVVQRQSLGSLPKRMVNDWLLHASDNQLLSASIGNAPSLADVLKMTHPKPANAAQEAFFAYVLGKPYQLDALTQKVQALEKFRQGLSSDVPDVPMQLLTSLSLNAEQWANIAKNGSWQMLRMNLNTFLRHGVFDIAGMAEVVAAKLVDEQAIAKSRVLPYQLMMTWSALDNAVPKVIHQALEQAMQYALSNVPRLNGRVVVAVDVSGSMSSPVTGHRQGATSKLRCVDAAALFASALKQVNPEIQIMPFDTAVRGLGVLDKLKNAFTNERVRVFEMARQFANMCGGGTDCSQPLKKLNADLAEVDLVIYFSDNESWADQLRGRQKTGMMQEWEVLKRRSPHAKLVCVDLQPYITAQMPERVDVMNIGGFSDDVFRLIDVFAKGDMHADHWVREVEAIQLKTYS
jgi:60 kDa SS-A/Ro ribonucleoprotein